MLSVLTRRRTVFLAGVRPLLQGRISDWLVSLRWVAFVGMLSTALVARLLVPGLALAPVLWLLAVLAVANAIWSLGYVPRVSAQLVVDVAVLGGVLWFTGGLQNPFAVFITFQVALAALTLSGTAMVAMAVLAVLVACGLAYAPALPWETARVPVESVQRSGELAALVGVVVFVAAYAYLHHQRIEQLRAESARNERFAALGRLMGGMAHEINTPLATIVVASDELVAVGQEVASEEVTRLSRTISQEAKRATNVIRLLRGPSRIGYPLEQADIGQMIRDIVPEELAALGFRGHVEILVESEVALLAWAIPTALRQILTNLLKNAVEALPTPALGLIRIRVQRQHGRVLVCVEDDGCGIPSEDLPHLGEPFRTTKQDEGGTGLGLYVCSLLAEQMGASLRIDSGDDFTGAPVDGPAGVCTTRATLSLVAVEFGVAPPGSPGASRAWFGGVLGGRPSASHV